MSKFIKLIFALQMIEQSKQKPTLTDNFHFFFKYEFQIGIVRYLNFKKNINYYLWCV